MTVKGSTTAVSEGRRIDLSAPSQAGLAVARKYDFILVHSSASYENASRHNLQPILMSLQFSETDSRGAFRRRLGGIIAPWRWRRVFLNEGIRTVRLGGGHGSVVIAIGAVLASTKIRPWK